VGFIAAGLLLDRYCPDPRKFDDETRHEWRLATDPKYQFTLSERQRAVLGSQIPVPPAIARALGDHGLELPANATLVELESKDGWKSDPERIWRIEEQLFTIEQEPIEGEAANRLWVYPDGERWSMENSPPREGFVLDDSLRRQLRNDKALSDSIKETLEANGFAVPDTATVREQPSTDREEGKNVWKIVIRHYSIEEAKLETDADARANGRPKALRDVLVRANTPRTLEETPPLPEAYANAHHIWYAFTGIGFSAFVGLLIFKGLTSAIDRKRASLG
jgi:hypothetical protein